jgi:hypothetical protein
MESLERQPLNRLQEKLISSILTIARLRRRC